MSLDPSVNLDVEINDEGPDPVVAMAVAWLRPLLPDGQVADERPPNSPLPFIVVSYVDGTENVEESSSDEVITVNALYAKGIGTSNKKAAGQFMDVAHRRMLSLARHLEPVVIGSRTVDIDYVGVFTPPRWESYADESILRKLARYRIGHSYAKLS